MKQLNKKGQALVEFILLLPVFLYLILVIFDASKIFYVKNDLNGLITSVIDVYEEGNNINEFIKKENKDNKIEISKDEETTTFKLYREINFISPGLGYFFESPYKVVVSRVISNE